LYFKTLKHLPLKYQKLFSSEFPGFFIHLGDKNFGGNNPGRGLGSPKTHYFGRAFKGVENSHLCESNITFLGGFKKPCVRVPGRIFFWRIVGAKDLPGDIFAGDKIIFGGENIWDTRAGW